MKRIPLTQGQYAIVDDEDFEWLSKWKWHVLRIDRTLYAARCRQKADGPGSGRILMHRVILCPAEGMEIDHVNGNGLDNRHPNLRAVTPAINQANHIHQKQNRKHDLPMGVVPNGRRFVARIQINRHTKYLGVFGTPQEAAASYNKAKRERLSVAG